MENISFRESHIEAGLQLVDIISSAIKRGMMQNLQFKGWRCLEAFIVFRAETVGQAITVLTMNENRYSQSITKKHPYAPFVNHFTRYGKNMILEKIN